MPHIPMIGTKILTGTCSSYCFYRMRMMITKQIYISEMGIIHSSMSDLALKESIREVKNKKNKHFDGLSSQWGEGFLVKSNLPVFFVCCWVNSWSWLVQLWFDCLLNKRLGWSGPSGPLRTNHINFSLPKWTILLLLLLLPHWDHMTL